VHSILQFSALAVSILLISCKEKSYPISNEPDSLEDSKPLIVVRNLAKEPKDTFNLRVRQYDAKALPLGEFYDDESKLKDAVLVADFTVINNAYEKSLLKGKSEGFHFESEVKIDEKGTTAELEFQFEFKGNSIEPKMLMKVGGYQLLEMSKSVYADSVKVYLIELERLQK